jgi:hypothetical protein
MLATSKIKLFSKTKNSYNFMKPYPDDGGSKFLHNFGRCLPNYTQQPSPEHNVMAGLLANYALVNKVNSTQIMERLFDRINLNGMVYHPNCYIL